MSTLVTGANGGLGKVLMPLIREKYGPEVQGSVRFGSSGNSYTVCDFTNPEEVERLVNDFRPTLVFHLVGTFTGEFHVDHAVNSMGAKHLFDAILKAGLNTKVVLIGSAAEYGLVEEFENPIRESQPLRPTSVYGLTKSIQTSFAKFYSQTSNLHVMVARIFNLALPNLSERLFYGRALAMIEAYKRGAISALEFGNLQSQRDYIGRDEVAKQLFAIADFGVRGEVYNVGSGKAQKMRELLNSLLTEQSIPDAKIIESSPSILKSKGFEIPVIYADTTKVKELFVNYSKVK
jgi:nucleoside-diphosphate-sugar epimerase